MSAGDPSPTPSRGVESIAPRKGDAEPPYFSASRREKCLARLNAIPPSPILSGSALRPLTLNHQPETLPTHNS